MDQWESLSDIDYDVISRRLRFFSHLSVIFSHFHSNYPLLTLQFKLAMDSRIFEYFFGAFLPFQIFKVFKAAEERSISESKDITAKKNTMKCPPRKWIKIYNKKIWDDDRAYRLYDKLIWIWTNEYLYIFVQNTQRKEKKLKLKKLYLRNKNKKKQHDEKYNKERITSRN